jgi:hypothetical protein
VGVCGNVHPARPILRVRFFSETVFRLLQSGRILLLPNFSGADGYSKEIWLDENDAARAQAALERAQGHVALLNEEGIEVASCPAAYTQAHIELLAPHFGPSTARPGTAEAPRRLSDPPAQGSKTAFSAACTTTLPDNGAELASSQTSVSRFRQNATATTPGHG